MLALFLATLIRWVVDPYLGDYTPYPTYFAAVAFVGIYGGLGPAVLTVVAGGLVADLAFLPPRGQIVLVGAADWAGLMLFALGGALIVALAEWFRASSANLAAIVSTAHEGIVTHSLDGVVTGWNAGAERMYGYTQEEMVGTSGQGLSPSSRAEETRWIIDEVKAGRHVEAMETERLRKDGRRVDVLLSAAPILDNRGRVRGIATIERDVTERKRVEQARRISETRLQAIIDNSPVVVFVKDLEGRYFLVNRAYVELFGTTVEAVVGATDFDRFPPEVAEGYRRNDLAVLTSGAARKFEETAVLEGGGTRNYLSTKFPLRDDHGEIYGICGICTDVTEQTRRHEQLLDLDKRKDQFLSMLAHELRNPLAPIVNAGQLIRLEGDRVSERVAWAGEVIERQARHLTRMVDDLLDIARFTTGRVQLKRRPVDIVELARRAVEDLRSRFDGAGVTLEVDLPDEAVMVNADAARIVQVIDNLLDNAAKYTDTGGRASLTVERRDGCGVLRVRDTGIGIENVHLDHIFDLFEQVDDSLDRSSGGLGLGLNLVKRMVELHGGSVTAASEGRNSGSEFEVRLPLAAVRDRRGAGEGSPCSAASARRVLVIEDNPDTARSMEVLLAALGHDVRVARTGADGLAMAAACRPELVLVDLGLPDIDGYQIGRSLRERFGNSLSLVALTGYGQAEHRRRTREAGFDDHLLKPMTMESLDRALAACARVA